MDDDQFTKLLKYMQQIDRKLDTAIDSMATKGSLERLTDRLTAS